jgi:hypothetical protein
VRYLILFNQNPRAFEGLSDERLRAYGSRHLELPGARGRPPPCEPTYADCPPGPDFPAASPRTSSSCPCRREAREGISLNVIQRQLGRANLGITSVSLQGTDNHGIIDTVHGRPAPQAVSAGSGSPAPSACPSAGGLGTSRSARTAM